MSESILPRTLSKATSEQVIPHALRKPGDAPDKLASQDDIKNSFILDTCRSRDGISLWEIKNGALTVSHYPVKSSFYVSFPDPHLYYSLIDGLDSEFKITECTIRTIYGEQRGYQVFAGREVAEQIEQQTQYQARLFNVDIRPEQRFSAETGNVPGGQRGLDRFILDHEPKLRTMEISCSENPHRSSHMGTVTIRGDGDKRVITLSGSERRNTDELFELTRLIDPDIVLFPDYDRWSSHLSAHAEEWDLSNTLSRTGKFRTISSRSYFSYGRMEHRLGARMPEGRLIIDTRQSFMYREGDVRGIFLASRLSGLSPNLACRLTPGTLISSYEVYEALAKGIAVPYRKGDAEAERLLNGMRLDYRGGLTLQPQPGIYEDVIQIDFTSFYPSIIVKYNLSPETLEEPDKDGFLAQVLDPILRLRLETKEKKKSDPGYAGMDGILKWMLVTCFGYTGYKNARFGRIEVHEQITLQATHLLQECVALVSRMNGRVLHAIIDCLFIQGCNTDEIQKAIYKLIGIHSETETYDWIVFLPQKNGTGSYANYFGRLKSGAIKIRGLAARRRNTPPYIRKMQDEMLTVMAKETDIARMKSLFSEIRWIYQQYREGIGSAALSDLVITRRIGRERYQKQCIAQAVIDMYQSYGVEIVPGMDASFIVRDEKKLLVDPAFDPRSADMKYYQRLLDKAWEEIYFVFRQNNDYTQE